jgi:hypothetical protein
MQESFRAGKRGGAPKSAYLLTFLCHTVGICPYSLAFADSHRPSRLALPLGDCQLAS